MAERGQNVLVRVASTAAPVSQQANTRFIGALDTAADDAIEEGHLMNRRPTPFRIEHIDPPSRTITARTLTGQRFRLKRGLGVERPRVGEWYAAVVTDASGRGTRSGWEMTMVSTELPHIA